jgi:hypothetical protein
VGALWREAITPQLFPSPENSSALSPEIKGKRCWSTTVITLEARCRSGHYLAAVLPMMDKHLRTEYHILVFRHGQEVYEETQNSLEEAIRLTEAYLDWRIGQDFDS